MNFEIARAIRRKFHVTVRGHHSPIPCAQGRTRLHLCDLWGELGYSRGVEIGVHRGKFAEQILTRTQAHWTGIDPWCEYMDSFLTDAKQGQFYADTVSRLKPFTEAGRATIMREKSLVACQSFSDESLDFVYIDGDHSFDAAVQDIIHWTPKVRTGGMIAVHDYMPMVRGDVRGAVDGYTYAHQIHPWYVICENLPTAFWVKT